MDDDESSNPNSNNWEVESNEIELSKYYLVFFINCFFIQPTAKQELKILKILKTDKLKNWGRPITI